MVDVDAALTDFVLVDFKLRRSKPSDKSTQRARKLACALTDNKNLHSSVPVPGETRSASASSPSAVQISPRENTSI